MQNGGLSMKTSLDDAGRIELPDFVQEQLGVKPGDELALEEEDGKWLITPPISTSGSCPETPGPDGVSDSPPALMQPRTASQPAGIDDEDLAWKELDYDAVPLERVGQVNVKIECRGRLEPMALDLRVGLPSSVPEF